MKSSASYPTNRPALGIGISWISWDEEPRRVKLAGEIAEAIRGTLPLSAEWDAMDFGCGTGLVTLHLAPFLRSILAVDSSRGMLDRLDAKVQAAGVENVRTFMAEQLLDEPTAARFKLITSAMTLHHIQDIVPLLRAFHARPRAVSCAFFSE